MSRRPCLVGLVALILALAASIPATAQDGIGDLVEVEGTVGTIERVGARSTSIRRADGIHLLIPNSLILERTVVNWAHADDQAFFGLG